MRLTAYGAVALAAAFFVRPASEPTFVVLSGDMDGYLSPCGCTKPMLGGLKRRVKAAKALTVEGRTFLLDNGGWITGSSRQDEIKAETIAEALCRAGWHAINFGPSEARLGPGHAVSLQQLSGGSLVSSVLERSNTNELRPWAIVGPLFVVAVAQPEAVSGPLSEKARPTADVVKEAVSLAQSAHLTPVLLLQGDVAQARKLALDHPDLALIQFRSEGTPSTASIGKTMLVSPGGKGQHIVRVELGEGGFNGFRVVALGPEYEDDAIVARTYDTYLQRIRDERLLEKVRRTSLAPYAGSQSCKACHAAAYAAWRASTHAIALRTLENEGHDRDPDCVSCHVVGLESRKGFQSRNETPHLTDVGCESCHGPAQTHTWHPSEARLGKAAEKSCEKCHTSETSPGFNFEEYWKKIVH